MAHSYTCLLYHLVFSTKDREPWLQAELRPRLWEYLSGAICSEGGFCLIANGVSDHVHLLARLRQDKAVSEVPFDQGQFFGLDSRYFSPAPGVSTGRMDTARSR